MEVRPVEAISGCLLFVPTPFVDDRGLFSRTFDADVARSAGLDPDAFVQDSVSRSALGVVRGLHVRRGEGEAKLVRCASGAVLDVVVDLRPASPTHLRSERFLLDGERQVSLYVPRGCAHGFQALSDPADIAYRIDRRHDPAEDVSIRFDDPDLAIDWPLPVSRLSERDRAGLTLCEALELLSVHGPQQAVGR